MRSTAVRSRRDNVVWPAAFRRDDVELVRAALLGEASARQELFDHRGPRARRLLVHILGGDPDLSGVLHELFERAFRQLPELDDVEHLGSWLTQLTVDSARRRLRSRRRLRFGDAEGEALLPFESDIPDSRRVAHATYSLLEHLAPDDRVAFCLHYVQGLGERNVAVACQASPAATERRLERARKRFRGRAERETILEPWLDPSEGLSALGEMLRAGQDAALDSEPAELQEVRERLGRLDLGSRRRRLRVPHAALVLAAIAVVVLAVILVLTRAEPLQFETANGPGSAGSWIDTSGGSSAEALRFSDGSSVLLQPRSRARVDRLQAQGAHLSLRFGSAAVSITPRPGARWIVEAGPFEVRVTGTRFDVSWDPASQRFQLALHDGTVVINGPSLVERPFVAGQRADISLQLEAAPSVSVPSPAP